MRQYRYIGPDDIRAAALAIVAGRAVIQTGADLLGWVRAHLADRDAAAGPVPATFVVMTDGSLRIAPRRSEHVGCASGEPVVSAGELYLAPAGPARVVAASNQSTGYCPEPTSWPAVAAALDRAGIAHPGRFTTEVTFRRCPECGQRNLVKDAHFVCGVCDAELPAEWNFDPPA